MVSLPSIFVLVKQKLTPNVIPDRRNNAKAGVALLHWVVLIATKVTSSSAWVPWINWVYS